MNITKRNFKTAFELAEQLAKQGLVIVKYTPDGSTTEEQLIKQGSAICWCAKEFVESPINLELYRQINKKLRDLTRKYSLKHKETKALLYEPTGVNQFDEAGSESYESESLKFLDELIEFSDIDVCICPDLDVVKPVPFELQPLNNLILCHSFFTRVKSIKQLPESASAED